MKRTVLVTGAAGGMGVRLVERLRAGGDPVRALVLPRDPQRARLEALGCEIRQGDVTEPASLAGLCDAVDTVYHLAAVIVSHDPAVFGRVNRGGTENLARAASSAGVRHFIYVSSASVTYPPRRTPYAESKLAAEAAVRDSFERAFTIVRPTLVYEPGGGQELMMFLDYLRRFPVVPFIGTGRALKRPVFSRDVVDGLALLLRNPIAQGKVYNLSGAEPISMRSLARLLLHHHDRPRPFLPLPVPLCRLLATLAERLVERPALTHSAIAGVVNDANLDPALAMRELGYRPLGVREGFRRCYPLASTPDGRAEHGSACRPLTQKRTMS